PEQWMVQCVEHIGPELQSSLLIDVGDLGDAYIEIRPRWPAERIASKRAIGALRRITHGVETWSAEFGSGEHCRVEKEIAFPSTDRLRQARIKDRDRRHQVCSH